ncbi:MAG: GHKL domain-containing protein [Lachnospiraceae bacterium]|nr:GHKL domain-containing protein [Lachnospiraceae bacterium]
MIWEVLRTYALLGTYFCFAYAFFKAKFKVNNKNRVIFFLILTVIILIRIWTGNYLVKAIMLEVLEFLAFFIIIDFSVRKRITIFIFIYVASGIIEFLLNQLINWYKVGYSYYWEDGYWICLRIALCLVYILIGKFRTRKRTFFFISHKSYWYMSFVVYIITIGLFAIAFPQVRIIAFDNFYIVAMVLLLLCILVIINSIGLVLLAEKRKNDQNKLKQKDKLLNIHNKYIAELSQKQTTIRAIKHNMNSQLVTINHLNQMGDRQKLQDYLDERISISAKISSYFDTGNKAASILVNYYADLAKEENISFSYIGEKIYKNKMPDDDMTSLFYNLLSNSYEECLRLSKEDERYINIMQRSHHSALILVIENSCRQELCGKNLSEFTTSKEDNDEHGYGMLIIKEVIKRYDGEIKIDCQSGKFAAEILLLDFNV